MIRALLEEQRRAPGALAEGIEDLFGGVDSDEAATAAVLLADTIIVWRQYMGIKP